MSFPGSSRTTRSATPSGVSPGIKNMVRAQTRSKCWLCKVEGKEVAHLLDKSDTLLLDLHIRNGLVKKTDINNSDNLICLCGTCHNSFDLGTPAWVYLPCPLEPYLIAERDFQAARLNDPSVKRTPIPRKGIVFQPYQIREGHINLPWDMCAPRKWHGEPVLAILRSHAIASGLQRLSMVKGGVPQRVAEMYLELVGLYGTAAPDTAELDTITLEEQLDEDTIRVVAPADAAGVMGPPPSRKRGSKRPATVEDVADTESVASSDQTYKSNDPTLTNAAAKEGWSQLMPGLRRRKRSAETDTETEIESVATSDATGLSNDTQLTKVVVPRTRAAKRARLGDALPTGVPRWMDDMKSKR